MRLGLRVELGRSSGVDDLVSFSGYQFPSEVRGRGDVSVIQSTKAPKRVRSNCRARYMYVCRVPGGVKTAGWDYTCMQGFGREAASPNHHDDKVDSDQ